VSKRKHPGCLCLCFGRNGNMMSMIGLHSVNGPASHAVTQCLVSVARSLANFSYLSTRLYILFLLDFPPVCTDFPLILEISMSILLQNTSWLQQPFLYHVISNWLPDSSNNFAGFGTKHGAYLTGYGTQTKFLLCKT